MCPSMQPTEAPAQGEDRKRLPREARMSLRARYRARSLMRERADSGWKDSRPLSGDRAQEAVVVGMQTADHVEPGGVERPLDL